MSTGTQGMTIPPLGAWEPYRLSLDQYEAMVRTGIFTSKDRLELIEGLLIAKMTKGTRHSAASGKCWRVLNRIVPPGWYVRIDQPVRLPSSDSMPEPDVVIARGDVDDHLDADPGPADIALVVEIADSSLPRDRQMARIYAEAGIPEFWLINLPERHLEIYSSPTAGAYPPPRLIPETGSVDLNVAGIAAGRIAVTDLLPRRT